MKTANLTLKVCSVALLGLWISFSLHLRAQAPAISITPANSMMLVGETQQFTAGGALTVTALAGGGTHTCLRMSDGSARCMGRNNQGQLGTGDFNSAAHPMRVNGLTTAVTVKTGMEHTCALLANGTMQCWGTNYTGQLGLGGATGEHGGIPFALTPTTVQGISNAIAAIPGGFHTCAILADRTVQCWGRNQDGQLGNGDSTTDTSLPGPVSTLGSVAALAAGGYHNCALLTDRTVRCWGRNDDGQLGTGNRTRATTPVVVPGLQAGALSLGGYHSCALLADGTVQCWGKNEWGQVGQPPTSGAFIVPTTVPGISQAVAIYAGPFHTCALLADGSARCWGQNQYGQVGDGTITSTSPPAAVSGIASPSALAVGGFHACALLPDTAVHCWGLNDAGQLGNDTTTNSALPVKVTGTGLTWTSSAPTVASIAASGLARAFQRGVTTIAVTDGAGASASTTLTVKEMLTLSVMGQGDGQGTVTSAPAGINCGTSCWASFLSDSQVTLTATPAANSTLANWSGCDAVAGLTCTVTQTAARTVTATFTLNSFALTVNKADAGSGTVTSNPSGITCGSDCSETFVSGTTVTLTAAAASGSAFTGWNGCTTSSGSMCTVTMSAARTVTATFKPMFTLTVNKSGLGKGTVTSTPAGVNCGADCSEAYISGTTVILKATPALGSVFLNGWSGCNTVSGLLGETCTVTMSAAKSVTASFLVGLP